MSELFEACQAVKAAFGAPGDYGYGTKEGDALFRLYRAMVEAPAPAPDLYALSGHELDTVIAALRLWQFGLRGEIIPTDLLVIASNGAAPLAPSEVDALAERLLFAGFAEAARRRNRPCA